MSSIELRTSPSVRITHYWIPVALMLMFQYVFSTGSFSSSATSSVIIPVLKSILHNPTAEQLLFWHHAIRKAAHITEYFILGMLVYRAIKVDVARPATIGLLTMLFVAVAATMDEFHQSFVPSRGASIIDIGWDCIGGVVAIALIWIWRSFRTLEE
jgi:VanZ family protein